MTTTTRKQTPAQARKSALDSDFATLYALAGLTDTLAEQLKALLASTREKAAGGVSGIKEKQAGLEVQVKTSADELSKFLKTLPEQVKVLPEASKAQVAKAQQHAEAVLADANKAYGDFAGRGKRKVDEAILAAKKLSGKASRQTADVAADVAEKIDPGFEAAQEGVTKARKTVTGHTATETVTPRSSAKASATRAAKKAPARRTTAKKAPVAEAAQAPAAETVAPAGTAAEAGSSDEAVS